MNMTETGKSIWDRASELRSRAMEASGRVVNDLVSAVGASHPVIEGLRELTSIVYAMGALIGQLSKQTEAEVGQARHTAVVAIQKISEEMTEVRTQLDEAHNELEGIWDQLQLDIKQPQYKLEHTDRGGNVRGVMKPWVSQHDRGIILTQAKTAIKRDQETATPGVYYLFTWNVVDAQWDVIHTMGKDAEIPTEDKADSPAPGPGEHVMCVGCPVMNDPVKTPVDYGFSLGGMGEGERALIERSRRRVRLTEEYTYVPVELGDVLQEHSVANRLEAKGFGYYSGKIRRFWVTSKGIGAFEEYHRLNPLPSNGVEDNEQ